MCSKGSEKWVSLQERGTRNSLAINCSQIPSFATGILAKHFLRLYLIREGKSLSGIFSQLTLLKDPSPAAQIGITSRRSVIPISATGILAKLYIVVPTIFYTYKFYYKPAWITLIGIKKHRACTMFKFCGKRGIRTPGTVTRTPHFECGPFDHSGIFPKSVAKVYKIIDSWEMRKQKFLFFFLYSLTVINTSQLSFKWKSTNPCRGSFWMLPMLKWCLIAKLCKISAK